MSFRAFILSVAFCFSALNISHAQPLWSFEDHPHPKLAEHSDEELAKLDAIRLSGGRCAALLEASYAIYLARYPAFAAHAQEPQMRAAWRRFAVRGADSGLLCPYGDIGALFSAHTVDENLFFCGRFSQEPVAANEIALANALEELVDMTTDGTLSAAALLLTLHDFYTLKASDARIGLPVRLNDDVAYALYLMVRGTVFESEALEASTRARLGDAAASVDEHIANGDLAAVFAATGACE